MAGGLHFDSLADMPAGMRQLAVAKLVAGHNDKPEGPSEQQPKQNKYRNIETEVNGIHFKSKKEASRYVYLKCLLDKGIIRDLKLQKQYTLQESFVTSAGERIRAIRYDTDFTYRVISAGYDLVAQGVAYDDVEYWRTEIAEHGPGVEIIEDTKSRPTRTAKYIMKYKMMAEAGYHIREV